MRNRQGRYKTLLLLLLFPGRITPHLERETAETAYTPEKSDEGSSEEPGRKEQ